MKALASTVGMVEGYVAAIRAGADVVETGAQDYPDLIELIPRAVHEAIEDGRLMLERLQEASRRALSLAGAPSIAPVNDDLLADLGQRCIEITAAVPALDRPLVVECHPPNNMATGELPWSVASRVRALLPRSDSVIVTGPITADELRASAAGRGMIAVVRDPIRYPWQRTVIEVAAMHGNAVIVDVGWPADLPDVPVVRTRGIAPGLLDAAVSVLAHASAGVPR
jgi:beta-N-acetylhexosaminidase